MLQYSTVEPATLAVLIKLMAMPELSSFYLVGGTALALYYGHRKSVDIDLFSTVDFSAEALIPIIEKHFSDFAYSRPNNIGIFGFIGEIKVDFVRYQLHPMIGAPIFEESIRLMSIEDIMAMKVAAILKRAVKKDFWDIAELLNEYTIDQVIKNYYRKYPNQQLLISIPQALTYFEEAEESEQPISLKGQTWKKVQQKIQKSVAQYLK
ncbi:MAG: nucleotidyl transferase AbiEii/AbiGii toxin family protein [Taibaiella sp.]|nr:nucleotidyl transferase AbiEii/AbiGii toxin family protein [Taibaiella sp.]